MYGMGKLVMDRFSAYAGKRFRMSAEGRELFENLAAEPGAFMMLGSHLGHFEMVGYMMPSPRPIKVLVYAGETATVMQNRSRMFAATQIERSHKVFRLPFLGADANFPQGPFILAAQREVPVLVAFAIKENRSTYHIVMRRLEIPQEGTSAQRAKALAVSYVSILETMARRYPEQWYNFFDFWAE